MVALLVLEVASNYSFILATIEIDIDSSVKWLQDPSYQKEKSELILFGHNYKF